LIELNEQFAMINLCLQEEREIEVQDLKVVIVDSNINSRRNLDRLIRWVDLDVELAGEANNGEEAMNLLPYVLPHIVLTEIRMPKMDGIKFIESAKKRWPFTKYIIVSEYDSFEYLRQAMKVGAFDYIRKPVDSEEINISIKRARDEVYKDMQKRGII